MPKAVKALPEAMTLPKSMGNRTETRRVRAEDNTESRKEEAKAKERGLKLRVRAKEATAPR